MIHRYRDGLVPTAGQLSPSAHSLEAALRHAPGIIDTALTDFDFRRAIAAVWAIVDEANRYINHTRPWDLAKAERDGSADAGHQLDVILAALIHACATLAEQLTPFLPDTAERVTRQCTVTDGRLPDPSPVFRRIPTQG